MKTIPYLRIKARVPPAELMFDPVYNYCRLGTARPGFGLPSNYNAAIHGDQIWPVNKGTHVSGWVGVKFRPTQPIINFHWTADDAATIYLNKTMLFSTRGWSRWASLTNVAVVPGREYGLSIHVADIGGAVFGCTGRIYYNDGTNALKTTINWLSA